jgi:hypothetical protein
MNFDNIVKVPYTTLPHMQKYEGELLRKPPSEFHLKEKRFQALWESSGKVLYPNFGLSFASDLARHKKLIKHASVILGFEPIYHIVTLGSKMQEDIVIVDNGRIEAAYVSFPSGWNPADAQGKTLEQLHAPVADGDVLRKMSNKLAQLMCGDYCYHRWVWTLTTHKHLSNHPMWLRPEPTINLNNLYFRTEHQITFPIVKGYTSGFLINVDVIPFLSLTENQRELIRESINSMSDNVLKYKHLEDIKLLINAN